MNGIAGLLPILLIFVVFYLFLIKPARKRQQEAANTQNSLRPGMEVRTVAGLFARVSEVEDDAVILEIAPGVHSRYLKSAIVAVIGTDDAEAAHGDHEDHEDDEHDDDATAAGETGDETTVVDLGKAGRAEQTADAVHGGDSDTTRKD